MQDEDPEGKEISTGIQGLLQQMSINGNTGRIASLQTSLKYGAKKTMLGVNMFFSHLTQHSTALSIKNTLVAGCGGSHL